jgi:hypothetical protein
MKKDAQHTEKHKHPHTQCVCLEFLLFFFSVKEMIRTTKLSQGNSPSHKENHDEKTAAKSCRDQSLSNVLNVKYGQVLRHWNQRNQNPTR